MEDRHGVYNFGTALDIMSKVDRSKMVESEVKEEMKSLVTEPSMVDDLFNDCHTYLIMGK